MPSVCVRVFIDEILEDVYTRPPDSFSFSVCVPPCFYL